MHGWILINMSCADILQLIQPITDKNTDTLFFFFTPKCRAHQLLSLSELIYSNMVCDIIFILEAK